MALGSLMIIFIILGIAAVLGQILLYKGIKKDRYNGWVFYFNMLLGIIISYLNYSSLPNNDFVPRGIALIWGFLAVIALPIKLKFPKLSNLSKALLTLSIGGGLIQLFS